MPASAEKPKSKIVACYEIVLDRYWIPLGFLIFLSGFFWAPSQHNYKVIVSYALLLPAFLSAITFRRWRDWFFATPVLPLLLLYMIYMVTMAALRGSEPIAFAQWSFYILVFLFGLSAQLRIAPNALIQLLATATTIAACAAVYTIAIDWHNGSLQQIDYRLVGYGALYNALKSGHLFGAFAVIGAWCAIAQRSLRTMGFITCATCLLAVLLTGSRAPCLAMLTVAAWNIFGFYRGRSRYLALLALAIVASILAAIFWHKLSERGLSLRPEVWSISLKLARAHPWFGAGLGSGLDIPMSIGDNLYDTHNVFIAVFYYGGAVGLLLFALTFIFCLLGAWRRRRQSPIFPLATALQLYGLATLQFDGGSLLGRPTEYWVLYWVPMALYYYAACRYPLHDKPWNSMPSGDK